MTDITLHHPIHDGPVSYNRARIVRRPTVRDRISAARFVKEAFGDDPSGDAIFAGLLGQVAEFRAHPDVHFTRLPPDTILDADYATFTRLVKALTGEGPAAPFSAPTTPDSSASSPPSAAPDTDPEPPSLT